MSNKENLAADSVFYKHLYFPVYVNIVYINFDSQ